MYGVVVMLVSVVGVSQPKYDKGTVYTIEVAPGSGRLDVLLIEQRRGELPLWLDPVDVTFDGKKVTAGELVTKVMGAVNGVRFESLTDTRKTYGVIRKAKFTTIPQEK